MHSERNVKNFWDNLPKPFFALAPMEDVTDVVFRSVITKAARPDVFFSEFTNVSGLCNEKGFYATRRRLTFSTSDQPIVAQLWGSKPENFAEATKMLTYSHDRLEGEQYVFSGIDINMGCPDKAVVKSGGGSALIDNPELAVEIIQAVKNASDPAEGAARLEGVPRTMFSSRDEEFSGEEIGTGPRIATGLLLSSISLCR
jgi:tRNA-dihydrouridine synthase